MPHTFPFLQLRLKIPTLLFVSVSNRGKFRCSALGSLLYSEHLFSIKVIIYKPVTITHGSLQRERTAACAKSCTVSFNYNYNPCFVYIQDCILKSMLYIGFVKGENLLSEKKYYCTVFIPIMILLTSVLIFQNKTKEWRFLDLLLKVTFKNILFVS